MSDSQTETETKTKTEQNTTARIFAQIRAHYQHFHSLDAKAQTEFVAQSNSRTVQLLAKGMPKIAKKYGEEAVEVVVEAMALDQACQHQKSCDAQQDLRKLLVDELADHYYFMLVLMAQAQVSPQMLWDELERRHQISEAQERASRSALKESLAR